MHSADVQRYTYGMFLFQQFSPCSKPRRFYICIRRRFPLIWFYLATLCLAVSGAEDVVVLVAVAKVDEVQVEPVEPVALVDKVESADKVEPADKVESAVEPAAQVETAEKVEPAALFAPAALPRADKSQADKSQVLQVPLQAELSQADKSQADMSRADMFRVLLCRLDPAARTPSKEQSEDSASATEKTAAS